MCGPGYKSPLVSLVVIGPGPGQTMAITWCCVVGYCNCRADLSTVGCLVSASTTIWARCTASSVCFHVPQTLDQHRLMGYELLEVECYLNHSTLNRRLTLCKAICGSG